MRKRTWFSESLFAASLVLAIMILLFVMTNSEVALRSVFIS